MSAESSFAQAVANFSHGGRYDNYLRVVRLGLNARNGSAEAVLDYILANAPPPKPNPAKIREAISYALKHDRNPTGSRHLGSSFAPVLSEAERRERRRLLLPSSARQFVPVTLGEYWKTSFTGRSTADIIGEAIRMSDDDLHLGEESYRLQAVQQLRALYPCNPFLPNDRIWAGTIAKDANGITKKTPFLWYGIIEAEDLAVRLEAVEGMPIPCHISLNAQTGRQGMTSRGKLSFDCLDTLATFRHVLIEFDGLKDPDGLPSQAQIDIIAGLIDYANETDAFHVVCAVYTGGKSIHLALRIKADNLDEYRRQCAALADLFASADDAAYRIDTSGWATGANATTHIRLAGAIRPETGRRARLIYCMETKS